MSGAFDPAGADEEAGGSGGLGDGEGEFFAAVDDHAGARGDWGWRPRCGIAGGFDDWVGVVGTWGVEDGDGPCVRCGWGDDGEIGEAGGGGVAAGCVFAEGVDAIAVGVVSGIGQAEGGEP